MAYALLQNQAGNFVKPDDKTFQAAAAGADWRQAPGFYQILTDAARQGRAGRSPAPPSS